MKWIWKLQGKFDIFKMVGGQVKILIDFWRAKGKFSFSFSTLKILLITFKVVFFFLKSY